MLLPDILLSVLAALAILGLTACAMERRWGVFAFALVMFVGMAVLLGVARVTLT